MIYADLPRKYKKRGKMWSHVFSPDPKELKKFAFENGLKRRDTSPFLHYDVTAAELVLLLDKLLVVDRREIKRIMGRS